LVQGNGFSSIKSLVETQYPLPIASVFRRCRIAKTRDLGGRHKNLNDLFEVFIKILCIGQLQEARTNVPNLKELLPQKEKSLDFLKRPSLGQWVGLLRILSNLDTRITKTGWLHQVAEWYKQPRNSDTTLVLSLLSELKEMNYDKRTKYPNAEICNALVNYRNKQIAHAANIRDEELKRRLPILEKLMVYLLESAVFLQDTTLFFTDSIEKAENKLWLVRGTRLCGASEEPLSFHVSNELDLSEIYFAGLIENRLEETPICMGPFLLWRVNEELKKPEIYFYNDARRTNLEYLSYTSGSYYYHKELHSGFEKLIKLKLRAGVEEDAFRFLPLEERAERAEALFKRANMLAQQGQLEDAIEAFETSIEYERRPETFIEIARIEQKLGDPDEAVINTLQYCLDIDPGNKDANEIMRVLSADGRRDGAEALSVKLDTDTTEQNAGTQGNPPTIWHALTPHIFRKYTVVFWAIVFLGWYLMSAMVEFLSGNTEKVILQALQLGMTILGMAAILMGRLIVERMRISLSLQLDTMRLDRFNEWFDGELELMFGRFRTVNGRYSIKYSISQQKYYYIGCAIWVWIIGVVGFLCCELQNQPVLDMIRHFIDNIIVVGFVAYTVVVYMISSTMFVLRFSRLSLKPMLTKINDVGLRAFAPMASFNILIICLIWCMLWPMAILEITLTSYIEFFFIVLGSAVIMVWSIGMPYTMFRAAQSSKSKAVHTYSEHIEKSFKEFLDHPSEDTVERFKWLVKNQSVIQKISTWPMSVKQTVFVVVGGNVVIFAMVTWYVLQRLGRWSEFIGWIRNTISI